MESSVKVYLEENRPVWMEDQQENLLATGLHTSQDIAMEFEAIEKVEFFKTQENLTLEADKDGKKRELAVGDIAYRKSKDWYVSLESFL